MHGNNKIAVPVTLAKIASTEGLCTSAERGTKSLSLQSLAAYSQAVQYDLLAAAGKAVIGEFKDYFQARALKGCVARVGEKERQGIDIKRARPSRVRLV